MTRKAFLLISILFVLIAGVNLMASDIYWAGHGATNNWTDNNPGPSGYINWYYGGPGGFTAAPVPGSADVARSYASYYGGSAPVAAFPTISSAVPTIAHLVTGGDANGVTSLSITSSGSLTTTVTIQNGLSVSSATVASTINNAGSISTATMYLGYQAGGTGILNTSGTVTLSGNMLMGQDSGARGILNQTDGVTTVAGGLRFNLGGTGHIQLDGGTMTAGGLNMAGDHNGTIDLANGILKVAGDVDGGITWLVGLGDITAFGGWGDVRHDYNITNSGKTTVWAEPNDSPAQNIFWDAGGADRLWSTRGNWVALTVNDITLERAPRSKDTVFFTSPNAEEPNGAVIQNGIAAQAAIVVLRGSAKEAVLTMNGGSLDVVGNCYIASGFPAGDIRRGRINVSGGTVDVGGTIYVGDVYGTGVLNMTGGNITCGQLYIPSDNTTATGRVQLYGGTITTEHLGMYADHSGTLDITNGRLLVAGDVTGGIATLIGQGDIIANGGIDTVLYDYNVTNPGYTTVRTCTSIAGDLDKNCKVDFKDFAILAAHWLEDTSH